MTDPLLTIEDATREFRVSPKTIRRRLSSGEIDGAYKRPGNRGPEWVMPRGSLAAAGFVPRPLAAPATLPTDADERAAYWERRAVDAEAALRAAEGAPPPARRQDWRGLGWAFVAVSLLIALIAGLIVLGSDDGDDAEPAPDVAGAMPLVVELLERETDPGDAIGLVGERRTDALPSGRVAAASPRSGWESSAGPRFVVATFDDEAPPAPVRALRTSSEVVLRAPHAGMVVEVYDRRSPADGGATEVAGPPLVTPDPGADDGTADPATAPEDADPAPAPEVTPSTAPAAAGEAPEDAEGAAVGPSATPSTPAGPAPAADVDAPAGAPAPSADPAAPAATPSEVQVRAGESFWSIAEGLVTAELGADATDATITSYWSALTGANADRLVEPGNPDLLHVGQTILLPPVT